MKQFDFNGTMVSPLGLGMMRLPCRNGDDRDPDETKTAEMVDHAIENGVNYFDTAWMYHGGKSEEICSRVFKRHRRQDFLLADKFPGQLAEAVASVEKTFETQMQRTNAGHFDFYLLHNVCESNIDIYLNDEKYGIVSFLQKQKAAGKIRHLGFSCHSSVETTRRFLERYADIMEFGQIQLNYLDWHLQDAQGKVALFDEYDIPVWVMEPLRGGALARPEKIYLDKMQAMNETMSAQEWGFRFLQSLPQVKVVLSGMSNMEQLCDNIRIFSEARPLTPEAFAGVVELGDQMIGTMGVPCTGCRYCVAKCPQQLDIPFLLAQYNEFKVSNGSWIARMMIKTLDENKRPDSCVGCRSCENICPQQIKISEAMKAFAADLAGK